ncbi:MULTISPECIES: tetratricopeptide repeat protein [Actinomycetes]|uniref:Tetratricopeptide repeat protein n=2 Tax=Actinomycetes TaxID=1760 RepID=A0ABP6LSU1_9MICC
MEGLRRAHLVESCGPHRYRLHDLLRSYAIELTEDHEGDTVRQACLDRLCRHYLRGVAAALEILMPEEMTIPKARDLLDADTVRPFSRKTDAAEWLEQKLPHLLVTAEHCADGGQPRFAVVLSKILRRHLDRSPYLHTAHRLQTASFLAGRRLEDLAAQGHSLRMLGRVALLRVQLEESRELLERSVDCHLRAGEEREGAVTRGLLGGVHAYRGDIRGALREHRSSVDTLRSLDDPAVCFSLANWGLAHHLLGEADEARRLLHEAVDISRQRGSPYGESVALLNLTLTYASTGEHEAALDLARRTLRLATRLGRRARACQALVSAGEALHGVGRRKVGHRLVRLALTEAEDLGQRDIIATAHLALGGLTREARALQHSRSHLLISLEQARGHWDLEALTLISLGETCSATQDPDGAREAWGQALAIYERVGHAHTPVLRRRLQGVESPAVT